MKAVENAFAVLWERHPTDKERQRLMRGRDAVGIKDNDALWTLLMVLEHYETLYERFPALIAKAASDVTDNARASAEAELKPPPHAHAPSWPNPSHRPRSRSPTAGRA